MKSMTGFAKKQCTTAKRKITVEIKTLNSKTLDINAKIPALLRSHELELRSLLTPLERGKVDLIVTEEASTTSAAHVNADLVASRHQELQQLAASLGQKCPDLLSTILAMPDVWNTADSDELEAAEWEQVAQTVRQAVAEVDHFRLQEGEVLKRDFVKHVDAIEQRLHRLDTYEAERIDTAKERIRKYFAEAAIKEVDQNRFEQELIYYL